MGLLGNLIPLAILFGFVGGFAWVGYQMYLYTNELADRGKKKMQKSNVSFSRDGMKVGVKHMDEEEYADKTQSVLVNTWKNASFPAYKSRLGWNSTQEPDAKAPSGPKKSN